MADRETVGADLVFCADVKPLARRLILGGIDIPALWYIELQLMRRR